MYSTHMYSYVSTLDLKAFSEKSKAVSID